MKYLSKTEHAKDIVNKEYLLDSVDKETITIVEDSTLPNGFVFSTAIGGWGSEGDSEGIHYIKTKYVPVDDDSENLFELSPQDKFRALAPKISFVKGEGQTDTIVLKGTQSLPGIGGPNGLTYSTYEINKLIATSRSVKVIDNSEWDALGSEGFEEVLYYVGPNIDSETGDPFYWAYLGISDSEFADLGSTKVDFSAYQTRNDAGIQIPGRQNVVSAINYLYKDDRKIKARRDGGAGVPTTANTWLNSEAWPTVNAVKEALDLKQDKFTPRYGLEIVNTGTASNPSYKLQHINHINPNPSATRTSWGDTTKALTLTFDSEGHVRVMSETAMYPPTAGHTKNLAVWVSNGPNSEGKWLDLTTDFTVEDFEDSETYNIPTVKAVLDAIGDSTNGVQDVKIDSGSGDPRSIVDSEHGGSTAIIGENNITDYNILSLAAPKITGQLRDDQIASAARWDAKQNPIIAGLLIDVEDTSENTTIVSHDITYSEGANLSIGGYNWVDHGEYSTIEGVFVPQLTLDRAGHTVWTDELLVYAPITGEAEGKKVWMSGGDDRSGRWTNIISSEYDDIDITPSHIRSTDIVSAEALYGYTKDKIEALDSYIDPTNHYAMQSLVIDDGKINTSESALIFVPYQLSDLADDETHRLVTDSEKTLWNLKQNTVVDSEGIVITDGDNQTYIGHVRSSVSTNTFGGNTATGTKVPIVSFNNLGHINSINEVTVYPPKSGGTTSQVWMGNGDDVEGRWVTLDNIITSEDNYSTPASSKSVYDFVKNEVVSSLDSSIAAEASKAIASVTVTDGKISNHTKIAIPTKLLDLAEDTTHRVITDTERTKWNSYETTKENLIAAGANITITRDSEGNAVISAADAAAYAAGTGLVLSGNTFNHSNSVTANTSRDLMGISYDDQGHITNYRQVTVVNGLFKYSDPGRISLGHANYDEKTVGSGGSAITYGHNTANTTFVHRNIYITNNPDQDPATYLTSVGISPVVGDICLVPLE